MIDKIKLWHVLLFSVIMAVALNYVVDLFATKEDPVINHYHEAKEVEQFQIIINKQDTAHYENNKNIDTIIITSSYDSLYEYLKRYHSKNAKLKGFD